MKQYTNISIIDKELYNSLFIEFIQYIHLILSITRDKSLTRFTINRISQFSIRFIAIIFILNRRININNSVSSLTIYHIITERTLREIFTSLLIQKSIS